MISFQSHLCGPLRCRLVFADQHDGPAVRRSFCSNEFIDRHVGSDRRALKMPENDDAHQVPTFEHTSIINVS